MFVTDYFCGNVLIFGITLITVIIAYYKWSFQYWKRKNVPYLEPTIPFGNGTNLFTLKEHFAWKLKDQYNEMKANGWKHGGIYNLTKPVYVVVDLNEIRNVMTKDFQYFTDREVYHNEKDDPLSAHLFAIGGTKWRNLRMKLTPTFTSGKMKTMFQTLVDCEPNLVDKIENEIRKNEPVDIKEVLGCFTTDIIGSCAFGLDCHTFNEENSPFREYGKKVFAISLTKLPGLVFAGVFPNVARSIGITFTPKDASDFFMKIVKDTVDYREKNNYRRNDFMQLLIDLKNNKLAGEEQGYQHNGKTLTIEEVAAQSYVFFIAGFETSSTTMTFALYELARNQHLQQKVRDEIEAVLNKHQGKITYEAIQEMKYMDQVINETLRMYPPLPILTRVCVKDYKVPDEDFIIEKGTTIMIPVLGVHYDEEYYPDAEKFDPERFNEENKTSRHSYAHLPFGEGPRICIGMRFGLIQTKVGLTSLLKRYKFTVNKRTEEPLRMKPLSLVLAARGEIWLDVRRC